LKGDPRIIDTLNKRLSEELTAINQYMVHASMCANWSYDVLDQMIMGRAKDEMKHAEKLIDRILFLEGIPIVSNLNRIFIGSNVPEMFDFDHNAELTAIKNYNDSVKLAVEVGDNTSRELFESNLKEEEAHIDLIEGQIVQIQQMSVGPYLAEQIG
jgi:bacterioferritin